MTRPDIALEPSRALWHIDPRKIGVLGFSAGGHMAAAMSTHFEKRLYPPVDAADKESCRPNSLVYHSALRKAGVPVEMHLFVKGAMPSGCGRQNRPSRVGLSSWRRGCRRSA